MGGANSPGVGVRQHTILPDFSKNCMKLKEFGPPGVGGASLVPPLSSATDRYRGFTIDSSGTVLVWVWVPTYIYRILNFMNRY